MRNRHRDRAGFSLLELLVTTVIVVVLITLLVPALYNAREQTRRAGCTVNLMAMGVATESYLQNHGGRYPSLFFSFIEAGESGNVDVLAKPEQARSTGLNAFSPKIFVCPSDPSPETFPVHSDGSVEERGFSYGYNIDLLLNGTTRHVVAAPESKSVFFDGDWHGEGTRGRNRQGRYASPFAFAQTIAHPRHSDELNVLFVDCHVEGVEKLSPQMIDARFHPGKGKGSNPGKPDNPGNPNAPGKAIRPGSGHAPPPHFANDASGRLKIRKCSQHFHEITVFGLSSPMVNFNSSFSGGGSESNDHL